MCWRSPRPPRHGGRPDTAHRSCWLARSSKGSVPTLCSRCLDFRPKSFASMCCTRWTWARRRSRLEMCFFRSKARVGRKLFSISCMCVSACVLFVCACLSVLGVHVQLCFVSTAGPGLCRAQSRSGGIAELWNTIKLHCKTFHTQSRLHKLTWEMSRADHKPPKLSAKGAESRHLVRCCFELAMDFHKHQRSAHCLTVRGLFEQLFGLYMTMSVEPLDSAACARCSRQFCTLYKALSKEASDDNLWKLTPKMHMVQEMCEVQSELLGNSREFWTYRDEGCGGSATASTIPLRVLDTYRALSFL